MQQTQITEQTTDTNDIDNLKIIMLIEKSQTKTTSCMVPFVYFRKGKTRVRRHISD